jgi:hypothetical protein
LIITANTNEFAYVRFPTLNSQTMTNIIVQMKINLLLQKVFNHRKINVGLKKIKQKCP